MSTMQKHPALTQKRVEKILADGVTRRRMYREYFPVALSAYPAPGRIGFHEAIHGTYQPIKVGHRFGPPWSTHWVNVVVRVPKGWKGAEVHLLWDACTEACVWESGKVRQGLTGSLHRHSDGAGDHPIRPEYVLTRQAKGGETFHLYIEVACNHLFGVDTNTSMPGVLKRAEIAVFDRAAWDLHFDFLTVAEMMQHLSLDSPRGAQALYAANAFINAYHPEDRPTWASAHKILRDYLKARSGGGQHRISAIGHAHIDTAWLWPLAETRRKCYRSFSSVLRVMEEYAEFKFACSQAQHYAWIKEGQPELYSEIRRRISEGRFIPVGGTWIEPDCNLPSGESLVRQFLFGQRFFKNEFGFYCNGFWNPDVFGYNAQLPQLIRGAGMTWFLTQKLSWNQMNRPDAHTFWWEGLDGSRVLTHFPPTDTYNGSVSVRELLFHVRNYKDLERSNESGYLFGFGDGGGGPTREMMERIRRARDTDGLPKVTIRGPDDFFKKLLADAKPLIEKTGELYLETHRGTLTTQAAVKRGNRRGEELLHDVELLYAVADGTYPSRELDRLWKLLLLNQFHDIIPGSSIEAVYEDAARDHAELLHGADILRNKRVRALSGRAGKRILTVNTLDRPRCEVVDLPGAAVGIVQAPALGYSIATPGGSHHFGVHVKESRGAVMLENEHIRVRMAHTGRITELLDKKTGRSVLSAPGNRLTLYDDQPNEFEAWDIDAFHSEKPVSRPSASRYSVVEKTALRVTVAFEYAIGRKSRMEQRVRMDALRPLVEFETRVDWNESQMLLKAEFPTVIRSEFATYEIQFGHVRRPTHYNSSHDLARFEVCAHRWADLSEPGCGLALINDGKYGHSVYKGEMRLTLLRAPLYPDPTADRGAHAFRYALMLHAGDWRAAKVPDIAAAFNQPLLVRASSRAPGKQSWFATDAPAIRIDTVKKAEDGPLQVLRLYEMHGSTTDTVLTTYRPIRRAWQTNLLEEERRSVRIRDGALPLSFRPFEIKTLLIEG